MRHVLPAVTLLNLVLAGSPAFGSDFSLGYVPQPGPGENPALLVTPVRVMQELYVECEAGGETYTFEKSSLPAGEQVRLEWTRDTAVTEATCFMRAVYPDGYVDEISVPVEYSYSAALSVDLSRAAADVSARQLTVEVSAPVENAEITVIGPRGVTLDHSVVDIGGGPGEIVVPWVGDPEDAVLLEVTLRNGDAWAGFTYSPWFLDIPHDDVLFQTDSDVIAHDEEWKMDATLKKLHDVLEKYGDVVPVKLYIAGCTDTVGGAEHNRELSLRRARSIARWLRAHGYDKPIFYYGFGETLLSMPTGDEVDNASNRRALYMVGANPPPKGSGVPPVSWIEL